jgi:toxin ParE1/3/4
MRYSLKVTALAKQDLREIWRGLAEFRGLKQADQQLGKIEKKFQLLTQFPRSGPSRDELKPGLRSYVVGEFVVFYRVGDVYIEVVRVLNGRRDLEHLLDEPEV